MCVGGGGRGRLGRERGGVGSGELKKSIKASMMTDSMKSQPHTAYGF